MIDKKFLNEDGSMNVEKIDSLPLYEHIKTLEKFSLQESVEYNKLSKPRNINESTGKNYTPKQLTEEQFNSLEWVDADETLEKARKIIEKARVQHG